MSAIDDLIQALEALKQKPDGTILYAAEVHDLVDGIFAAMEMAGDVTVTTTPIEGGNRITITDPEGVAHEFDVMNGTPGTDGKDAVNPFKGYYPSGISKPATGTVGDYIYAPPSDQTSSAMATIWHYDNTQTPPWTDTGIDVSDFVGVEFSSGQSVPATKIKDENGEEVTGDADVLSAEAGKTLQLQGDYIMLAGANNTSVRNEVFCLAGHSYRIVPTKTAVDFSGVTYTSSAYDLFAIIEMAVGSGSNTVLYRRDCTTKSQSLDAFYDVYCTNTTKLRITLRCSTGESVGFNIEDTTYNYNLPKKTVVGYIANSGAVAYTGTNNRVSWYQIPAKSKVTVNSRCSDVIVGVCASIGQDTGIIPKLQGVSSDMVSAALYFEEETIIALTWSTTITDTVIKIESCAEAFASVYAGKSMFEIFEEGDLSGLGLLILTPVFNSALNSYFQLYSDANGLTNSKSIKITDGANRTVTVGITSGHRYAIVQTVRCDAFSISTSAVADEGYFGRGGAVLGISSSIENMPFSDIERYNYMPMLADKTYRTTVLYATANTTGDIPIIIGTRKSEDDDAIEGIFYLDNAFIIDLTTVFSNNIPPYKVFVHLFGRYLDLFNTGWNIDNVGFSDEQMKLSFVNAMNRKAQQIGMSNSLFGNPGGKDEVNNYFTANDALKMLCVFALSGQGLVLSSLPSYSIHVEGVNPRNITANASYKGSEQVQRLSPYTIIAGKTGTLSADAHADVGGVNMNTANVGLIVKSPVDGALLAGVVILPLTKVNNSWVTQTGGTYPYLDRYDVLKNLFDLVEQVRTGEDVSAAAAALNCGYAAGCVVPQYIDSVWDAPLVSKNGDTKCYPASMTKMMTLLTLIDNFDYNEDVVIYGSDKMGGSGISVDGGDVMKGSDAIIGMMLPSTNTIAAAFARMYGLKYLS